MRGEFAKELRGKHAPVAVAAGLASPQHPVVGGQYGIPMSSTMSSYTATGGRISTWWKPDGSFSCPMGKLTKREVEIHGRAG